MLTTLAQCERREEPVPLPTRSRIPEDNNFPDVCWETLDRIDLQDVYQSRFHVLQSCPHIVRGRFRQAVRALEARSEAVRVQDAVGEVRGWKLFCLLPLWLLRRSGNSQRVPKEELFRRFDLFHEGAWGDLMQEARPSLNERQHRSHADSEEKRAEAACRKVKLGEVSRARQCLTGACLAPGTDATHTEMQSKRPQATQRIIPREALEFVPDRPRKMFMKSLKSAPRGASPGPGGCTYEHLRTLLDDPDTFNLLLEALTSLAQASLPPEIATALSKPDGGVRGIATGCSVRRLVARTLAKQFASEFEAECAPFQCALSTRAGTDCVGHMLRAATDLDPDATILSVDGIGAFDHVARAAMLGRLATMPTACRIFPFVRLSYASPSAHSWWDDDGNRRTISQAEGGEQGDPLMPLLFSIGIQGAWRKSCACHPERVKVIYDTLTECLWRVAGIRLHQGKTRVWNKSGIPPPDVHQMGPETWQPEGIKVLGTPIGSTQYTHARMQERIADEQRLWNAIPRVPDLQCAWQLLLQSAGPRANHTIRTLPPESSHECVLEYDAGMWRTALALLGEIPGTASEVRDAEEMATLPIRMGGLGLQAAAPQQRVGPRGRRAPDDQPAQSICR